MHTAPIIHVAPRYVAAPWETEEVKRRTVQLEDYVQPEPGPLEDYLAAFPDRYVVWDRHFQTFAIYERGIEGPDALVERVFHWDAAPELELTDEQIAEMAGRSPDVIRRFMPFDYEFVRRRLRERAEYRKDLGRYANERNGRKAYARRIADRNAARAARIVKEGAGNIAAAAGDMKNWAVVQQEYEKTGRWMPGLRTARVAGATLT